MNALRLLGFLLAILLAPLAAGPARAQQEMLANRSFETTPTVTANGNNFFTSIQGWTTHNVSPAQAQPVNIIRPFADYGGGPTTVAPGDAGGINYFDVNSASGLVRQTITLPSPGTVTISGWFSTRDGVRALTGMQIRLLGTNLSTVHATSAVSFTTADPAFSWKQAAAVTSAVLPAGNYVFEITMPNESNFDLASAVYVPQLTVTKTSAAFSDPVNATTRPKQIPGGVVEYTITGSTRVAATGIVVEDPTPANLIFLAADMGAGTGPVAFTSSNGGLTMTAGRVDYSTAASGTDWTYNPSTAATGDPNVRRFRIRPNGTMAANTSFTLRVRYLVK